MIEVIVPIGIVLIALIGCKKIKYNAEYLSVEQGNSAKGVAALLLVLVHIRERLQYVPITYKVLASIGFCLVAIFFFYSGYGIVKQAKKNPCYISSRLPRRILYLVELIIVSETIYYAIDIWLFGREFSWIDAVKCITGYTMLNGAMWTILAMIVIQVVMLLLNPLHEKWGGYCLASIIGVTIYIFIELIRNRGPWEMQSCFAFVLGVFVAENEKMFEKITSQKRYFYIFALSFGISFGFPYLARTLLQQDFNCIRIIFGSVCSASFMLCLLCIFRRIKIINPLTKYLGTIFTEIYLFHGIILDVAKKFFYKDFCSSNSAIISIVMLFVVCATAHVIKQLEILIKQKKKLWIK